LQLFAAACHDVGHPGVTNGFRVATGDDAAITHNDRSVNENMHCSIAYRTLRRDDSDFLDVFSREQQASIRKLFIDIILSTDMAFHFDKLSKFNAAVEQFGPDPSRWDDPSTALEWLTHAADVSSTTKPAEISHRWTDCVVREFFVQGDRERALGLPLSPLCDRHTVSKATSQVGFVNFIVRPMFQATASICDMRAPLAHLEEYFTTFSALQAQEKQDQQQRDEKDNGSRALGKP